MAADLTDEEIKRVRTIARDLERDTWTPVLDDVLRLLDEVERRRGRDTLTLAMLKQLEWSRTSEATGSWESSCPVCRGGFRRHEPACELAALIGRD